MPSHDNSYKLIFSHSRMVEDLLRGFVREEWVEQLDFSTLEKVNCSYVSDNLKNRADDLVWRVRRGEDWLYVYILLEFQSTVDPWMAVRIMTYLGLLYQDIIRTGKLTTGMKLPPVLPVVLYNGGSRWTAATNVAELVTRIPGGLSRYLPALNYLLISEREYSAGELESLNNLVAALFRLENSHTPSEMLDVLKNLIEWLSGPEKDSLRRAFTVWFSRVLFPSNFEDPSDYPDVHELDEVKIMLAERVKQWKKEFFEQGMEQGMQQGMQQGVQQGVQQGMIRDAREMLTEALAERFGVLTPELLDQINAIQDRDLFKNLLRKAIKAKNLNEFRAVLTKHTTH